MLQNIRDNSQSIVAKIIVGFIVLTFALWGVDSLVGLTQGNNAPVSVNGVDITERQLVDGVELQRRQILARLGDQADPSMLDENLLRGAVLENLIEQELLLQSAKTQSMRISDAYLDQVILGTEDFQVDGRFDRNLFESLLRNVGMTPLMYRDYLRREKLLEQERLGVVASAFTLQSEEERIARLDRQTRDVRYLTLPMASVAAEVSVSEEEMQSRYQQERAGLVSDEQVAIRYLELRKQDLLGEVEVDEAELETQYQRLVDEFEASEARQAAHILIEFGEDKAAALEQAKSLYAEVQAGADFAELAAAHSQDAGSAEMGGDLGFMERGVFVPEFEEALYQLEEGQVSEPVETEFGYHLIKLLGVDRSELPGFDGVREQLVAEQRQEKAELLFVERAERLADLSFTSGDLREPAEELGLTIQDSGLFGRDGGAGELLSNPRILEAAFDPDVLESRNNSPLIELTPEHALVLRIKEHQPSRQLALDEVRDQLEAELRREKSLAILAERAEGLLAQVREALSLEAAAVEGAEWQVKDGLGRGDFSVDLAIKELAFRLAKPADGEFSIERAELASGDLALVAVTAVTPGELGELTDEQRGALQRALAGREGQQHYQGLLDSLKQSADIERL